MTIKSLHIQNFRNLHSVDIDVCQHSNIFFGENGAGKTSLLEALHYLSFGRSFRTNISQRIIAHEQSRMLLRIKMKNDHGGESVLALERHSDGGRRIKIDGELINSIAPLTEQLPMQLLSTYSYRYFHDGSKSRRQFLDWGLYYLSNNYIQLWQRYHRLLKQRNAALKAKYSRSDVIVWDLELAEAASAINELRKDYVQQLQPIFFELLAMLLPSQTLQLRYSAGWHTETPLLECLESSYWRDLQLGYTQQGPHRADLRLYHQQVPVKDFLSQGQQKLAAYALRLAQGQLLQQQSKQRPIYLIDDLPSELDSSKQKLIYDILTKLSAQIFITGINQTDLAGLATQGPHHSFHVKLGTLSTHLS